MTIYHMEQGSPEWLEARTGRITASEVGDAISFLVRSGKEGRKAGDSSGVREKYKLALAGEILTGQAAETFVSEWMKRGTALESQARIAYELNYDCMVEQVGFVVHPRILRSGASPDGLTEGGLEIKCPKIETHIGYIMRGGLPKEYEPQVMWNMACTNRPWWDFISYCPEMKDPGLRMFRVRVPRDDKRIAEMEAAVLQTLEEVDEIVALARSRAMPFKEALRASLTDDDWAKSAALTDEEIDSAECFSTPSR